MTTKEEGDTHFLSDNAIESVDEDEFRHREYVDTLEEVVRSVDPPWNIGVFGEWGSGKTSIIKMLYSRLEENDTDYVCVEFDAWKHAEESIRTDLLLNLDQAIGKKTGQQVNGEHAVLGEDKITRTLFDVEESEKTDDDDPSMWEEAKEWYSTSRILVGTLLSLLGVIVLGLFVHLLAILNIIPITDTTLSSVTAIMNALLFPLFISVFIFMAREVQKATSTLRRKHPRKEWSGAYEQLFDEIIDDTVDETGADKILITIDNLDRCESDTVYDVLVSLKSFLENDDCIYIVSCDDRALESHIESIDEYGEYFEEESNGREFLRKFFQTHLRIPPFIPEDIEKYAETQNQELNTPFELEVLDVITQAYVKNPRRIKQSLNRLNTMRTLAMHMESEGHLEEDLLTDNLDFLAKIMILEEDHPSFYNQLQKNPRLLKDVRDYFRGDLSESDRRETIQKILGEDRDSVENETQLKDFLGQTRHRIVDNPKPFIHLGVPSYAGELGDFESFIQNLWSRQSEDVREELRLVEENENSSVTPYIDAVDSRLGEYFHEGRYERLFNTVSTLVAVFEEFDENNQERLAEIIGEYLVFESMQEFFADFNSDEFFPVLLEIPEEDQETIFPRFAQVVEVDGNLRESALKIFVDNAEHVPRQAANQLSSSLLELGPDELKQSLEMLAESEDSMRLANPDLLERAAGFAEWNSNRTRFDDIEHYTQLDDQAEPRGRAHFVDCLLDFRGQVDDENEDSYYSELQDELSNLNGQVTFGTGSDLLSELIEGASTVRRSRDIVEESITFYNSYNAATREEFYDWLESELKNLNQRGIKNGIQHADEQGVKIFDREEIVKTVLAQIPNTLSDEDFVINSVIPLIPSKHDNQVLSLLERLTENMNHNESVLAANIFVAHSDRLEQEQEAVLERCRGQLDESESAVQKKAYLQAEATVYNKLSNSEKEGFVDRLGSLLSGDQKEHETFEQVWETVQEDLESEKHTSIARDLDDQLRSELRGNAQPNQLLPLLEVFKSLSERNIIDEEDGEWVVERLSKELNSDNFNNSQTSDLLDLMSEFSSFYGIEEQALNRVENLLSSNNNNQIHESSKVLIGMLKETNELEEEQLEQAMELVNI